MSAVDSIARRFLILNNSEQYNEIRYKTGFKKYFIFEK